MDKSALITIALGLALMTGACRNPDYQPADPGVEACNQGGPLTARQRIIAMEPRPQAVPGRPVNCQMGPDGLMRPTPPATP